jgi:streptogramin lyase
VTVSPATRIASVAFALLALGQPLCAQDATKPTNDLPNPYQTIAGWAKMPEGRVWGSTSAVDIDKDGTSIWVAERCGVNSCVGSNLDPILKFDQNGNLVAHFGAGMIASPHGIHVDKDDNVWVTDCSCTGGGGGRGGGRAGAADSAARAAVAATPPSSGHQIFKFSPDGKLLMTLGKAGGGKGTDFFWQPNDIVVGPNGDIWVSEGHSSRSRTPNPNAPPMTPENAPTARLFHFDKTGKLLKVLGDTASSAMFDQPHALAFDSKGRLFVGDRGNNRIKIFDQNLNLLDTWYQFSRPSGIFIDKNDSIYVADSESGGVDRTRANWTRGIRIGSATTGRVTALIPDPMTICQQGKPSTPEAPCMSSTSAAEGVAVDAKGNIYGAEVGPRALKKYVRGNASAGAMELSPTVMRSERDAMVLALKGLLVSQETFFADSNHYADKAASLRLPAMAQTLSIKSLVVGKQGNGWSALVVSTRLPTVECAVAVNMDNPVSTRAGEGEPICRSK